MRMIVLVVALVPVVACSGKKLVRADQQAARPPVTRTIEEDRAANEGAYQFLYVPSQRALVAAHKGEWIAIAGGKVIPANGPEPATVATMEEADALSRKAAPDARHRFLFQVGEEGDATWPLGGCELQHVVGNQFLTLLAGNGVEMKNIGPGERMHVQVNGQPTELTVTTADETRMYLRPQVGAPGATGTATADFCVATGFAGTATLSPATAAGLEMWEIPGTVRVSGTAQSGECRRARARMTWPNTSLDFVVPVVIWGK
jgi:hypothetical protein